jgi:hypothetical protein
MSTTDFYTSQSGKTATICPLPKNLSFIQGVHNGA